MNRDTAAGKFDQIKGKAKQSVGEALGNQKIANSGTFDQVKGAAKEVWGNTKDALHTVSNDAGALTDEKHAEASRHAADSAHDLRETIVATVQNIKSVANSKAKAIQREHKRSA